MNSFHNGPDGLSCHNEKRPVKTIRCVKFGVLLSLMQKIFGNKKGIDDG